MDTSELLAALQSLAADPQRVAEMSDEQFAALVDSATGSAARFRDVVKSVAPQHADEFMKFADPSKFVGADGQLDEARLRQNLTVLFGPPQNGHRDWGQHAGYVTGPPPGAAGLAEADRRKRVAAGTETDAASREMGCGGAGGRAEAHRRQAKGAN